MFFARFAGFNAIVAFLPFLIQVQAELIINSVRILPNSPPLDSDILENFTKDNPIIYDLKVLGPPRGWNIKSEYLSSCANSMIKLQRYASCSSLKT